jgi:tetratricopeptide (TPR) repeat protein
MTRTRIALVLIVLATLSASVAWFVFHKVPAPQSQNEAFKRAYELQKWGRYDAAVNVLQTWMRDDRRDVSNDDFLFQEIAMIYITKIYKRPIAINDSVNQADRNLDEALSVHDRQPPKGMDIMLFEIGGAYEILGDISSKENCRFYDKAKDAFARQLPLIKGDSYTAFGHTIRLDPVRADVKKHLDATAEKYSKAGCQAREENHFQ